MRPIEPELLAVLMRRSDGRHLGCVLVFHVDGLPIKDSRFYARDGRCVAGRYCREVLPRFSPRAYDLFLLNQMDLTMAMDLVGAALENVRRREQGPYSSRTADQQDGA